MTATSGGKGKSHAVDVRHDAQKRKPFLEFLSREELALTLVTGGQAAHDGQIPPATLSLRGLWEAGESQEVGSVPDKGRGAQG